MKASYVWLIVVAVILIASQTRVKSEAGVLVIENKNTVPRTEIVQCEGQDFVSYGMPLYHLDPDMQHMAGHPCHNDNQCNLWNPAPEGIKTECCMNIGVCGVFKN